MTNCCNTIIARDHDSNAGSMVSSNFITQYTVLNASDTFMTQNAVSNTDSSMKSYNVTQTPVSNAGIMQANVITEDDLSDASGTIQSDLVHPDIVSSTGNGIITRDPLLIGGKIIHSNFVSKDYTSNTGFTSPCSSI